MNTRLRPESAGTLDPAFADAGVLTFPLNGLPDLEAVAVLALPDKKTLVGFYPFELYGPATVARFHEDGTLDTQFGGGKGVYRNRSGKRNHGACYRAQPPGGWRMAVAGHL